MSALKKIFKGTVNVSTLGLLGGKKKKKEEDGPVELVSGDEEQIRNAKKKRIAEMAARSGRASTIAGQGTTGFGG